MPCVHDQTLRLKRSKPLLALVALISYGRFFTEWQGCIDTIVGQGGKSSRVSKGCRCSDSALHRQHPRDMLQVHFSSRTLHYRLLQASMMDIDPKGCLSAAHAHTSWFTPGPRACSSTGPVVPNSIQAVLARQNRAAELQHRAH